MAKSEPRCAAPGAIRSVLGECTSPALRLFKFATVGGDQKKPELDAVVMCAKQKQPFAELLFKLPLPSGAEERFYKLRSRLAINLAEGILENAGICLHPHFGVPMIPGYGWFEDLTEATRTQRAQTAARERERTRGQALEAELKALDQASDGRDLTPEEVKQLDALKAEVETFSADFQARQQGLLNRLSNRCPKAPELDYDKALFDQLCASDEKKRVKLLKTYDPKQTKKAKAIVNSLLQDEPFLKRLGTFKELNKVQQALMKAVKEAKEARNETP